MYTKQSLAALAVFSAAMAVPVQERQAGCNPAHSYPNGQTCVSTNGALSLVTAAPAASTTAYACNPAHSYPNGQSCVSTNGALSLVTAAPAASTTDYACNPAHSYPNGQSCVSTNGALSLVTAAPASSTTAYACNPAHSYPNGQSCVSTNGALSLVTAAPAASTTAYACNPAHSYPNGQSCVSTNGALSLVTAAPTQSVAASSAAAAVSTAAASSGETIAQDLTWTAENIIRYCVTGNTGCDYNFDLTASDDRPKQHCTISRTNVENATTESWSNEKCNDSSNYVVSWGYSDQFGADSAFAVMTVVNNQEKAKAYFGVANINSGAVTPSSPAGSGNFGNVGPQPVYLF